MDFHRLTRRELQALCKMNKIPANMTNIAMADALKGLDVVQGIQEFLQPTSSETTESLVESPVRIVETSPSIPPTGGRSTRRRNAATEEATTLKPVTRSRTDRKNALETSAFKKMDSHIKQSVEDEKKDLLTTPAPLGVASHRRRTGKEESVPQSVYSTRRSTRLAEKTTGAVNNVIEKDVLAKHQEYVTVNLTEGFDDMEQMSGTTGEEFKCVEEKEEPEDFSSQALDASAGREASKDTQADGSVVEVKMDIHVGTEQYLFDLESKADTGSMKHAGMEEFEDDRTITLTEGSQAQDTNGKHILLLGTEESQKYNLEEKSTTVEEEFRDEDTTVSIARIGESHCVEGVIKDLPFSESKITFENTAAPITDVNEEGGESSDVKMDYDVLPSGTEINKKMLNDWKIDSVGVHDSVVNEETATSATQFVNECHKEFNSCLANELREDKELTSMLGGAISVKAMDEEVKEDDAVSVKAINGIVIVQAEKDIEEIVVSCEAEDTEENSPLKHADGVQGEKGFISQLAAALDLNIDAFEEKDAPVVAINGCGNKASLMKKETKHVASDNNKENIDGGGSLVLTQERAPASKLNALSIRKLSKMLKDKLQITNDDDYKKKKNEDEVAMVRPALQALGENQ